MVTLRLVAHSFRSADLRVAVPVGKPPATGMAALGVRRALDRRVMVA
jgi:hypothetical protein